MRQTVEKAAVQGSSPFGTTTAPYFVNGFIAGAAWQRQQGIEWVSVETPPVMKDDFATPLLITDGKSVSVWYLMHDGLLKTGSHQTTHYAYINLPINPTTNATKEL